MFRMVEFERAAFSAWPVQSPICPARITTGSDVLSNTTP
jgi:hypothetical protein